jgi:hypothetical protein
MTRLIVISIALAMTVPCTGCREGGDADAWIDADGDAEWNPCEGVICSDVGFCDVDVVNLPPPHWRCVCIEGYHAAGPECLPGDADADAVECPEAECPEDRIGGRVCSGSAHQDFNWLRLPPRVVRIAGHHRATGARHSPM